MLGIHPAGGLPCKQSTDSAVFDGPGKDFLPFRLSRSEVSGISHSASPLLPVRVDARMGSELKVKLGPDGILPEVCLRVFQYTGQFENRGPAPFLNRVYAIPDHELTDARRAAHRCVTESANGSSQKLE